MAGGARGVDRLCGGSGGEKEGKRGQRLDVQTAAAAAAESTTCIRPISCSLSPLHRTPVVFVVRVTGRLYASTQCVLHDVLVRVREECVDLNWHVH